MSRVPGPSWWAIGAAFAFSPVAVGAPGSLALAGKLPAGYRDWGLVSVAHEAGNINDIRAILGNGLAIKAYRAGRRTFPDGSAIARLAWSYVPSAQNNRAFGRVQSYVAGSPTTVQFMVKDSHRYAATGGWGFTQFTGRKADAIDAKACFACHAPAKAHDFVFAAYSP